MDDEAQGFSAERLTLQLQAIAKYLLKRNRLAIGINCNLNAGAATCVKFKAMVWNTQPGNVTLAKQ